MRERKTGIGTSVEKEEVNGDTTLTYYRIEKDTAQLVPGDVELAR
jgi:hypothetical protein